MTTTQELRARLREAEEVIEAGVDMEDAELMVARYVEYATAAAAAGGSGASIHAEDEEIEQAVKVGKCAGSGGNFFQLLRPSASFFCLHWATIWEPRLRLLRLQNC